MRVGKSKLGFTLVELLVVCAIMAILVAVAVPMVIGQIDKSNTKADKGIQEAIVNNVLTGITQLQQQHAEMSMENVLNFVYGNFSGEYNKTSPAISTLGNLPYPIIPKGKDLTALTGDKYFEVEFIGYTKLNVANKPYIDHATFKVSLKKKDGTVVEGFDGFENKVRDFYPKEGEYTAVSIDVPAAPAT